MIDRGIVLRKMGERRRPRGKGPLGRMEANGARQ